MSTQDCKDHLVYFFNGEGIPTVDSDWKRLSKKSVNTQYGSMPLREFENSVAGLNVWTLGDDDEITVMEGGTLLYDVGNDPSMSAYGGGDYFFFCPESFWIRNNYIPDWHTADILEAMTNIPAFWLQDEVEENMYCPPSGRTIADLHRDFQAAGLQLRDMSSAGSAIIKGAGPDTYGEVTRNSPPPAAILQGMIELFVADDPTIYENGEISLSAVANLVMKDLNGAEKSALTRDLSMLLREYSIESFQGAFYAPTDKDNLLERLKSAFADPNSRHTPGKLASGFQTDTRPDVDISGMDDHELYRHVLRNEIPQITTIGWRWDDLEGRIGPATEDEIAFYCGYLDRNYKLIRDRIIPDDVFERILPEYGKTTWNDYEKEGQTNYHTMPAPDEKYVEGIRSHIMGRFMERGFRFDETILSPPPTPITPLRVVQVADAYFDEDDDMMHEIGQIVGQLGGGGISVIPANGGPAQPMVTVQNNPAPPAPMAPRLPTEVDVWRAFQEGELDSLPSIASAGFAFTVKAGSEVGFICGYLDEEGSLLEVPIPETEITHLFTEYQITGRGNGTFIVRKMLGQSPDELSQVIKERLADVKIVDMSDQ